MRDTPSVGAPLSQFQSETADLFGKLQFEVTYQLETSFVDLIVFCATAPCRVVAVNEVHRVAGTDAGNVNLQLEKITGTTAAGAGTNLLTNNSNAGFDLKGTVETVQNGTLTTTTADLELDSDDRLALDFAGTLTALAGVHVTISLEWL